MTNPCITSLPVVRGGSRSWRTTASWRPRTPPPATSGKLPRPPLRERLAEPSLRRGRHYQSLRTIRMPTCSTCLHPGSAHNWTVPPCSAPNCVCTLNHPRRFRGRCLVLDCRCLRYRPRTDRPVPVNRYIARPRRSLRGGAEGRIASSTLSADAPPSGVSCFFKKRSAGRATDKPLPALLDHVEPIRHQVCLGQFYKRARRQQCSILSAK